MNFGGKYEEMIQKDKLHVLSLSVLIDSLTDSPGGTAGNIAYNLGLLGASPRLFGVIGNNDQGYLTRLRVLGVNTDEVHLSPLATATYTVMTDSADNQVGGFFPGAMTDYETVTLSRVSPDNVFVVVSANDRGAMQKYVMEAKQLRIPFVYDPGQQVNNIEGGDIREGVTSCQILMINDYEMGVIVEKFHDSKGMVWPENIAPFTVHLLGLNLEDESIKKTAEDIYKKLSDKGVEVLFDDRVDVSAGEKFADADLIGIPYRLVISKKTGTQVEVKRRTEDKGVLMDLKEFFEQI